ncbi:Thioesterase superfamily protein [Salipiger mucosus DSM 16094]|uniref:Thioesterase superfamily protein n=1 Tax=Salipiger mucosus DSM 16094 TaxID=1123237 RepID=S9QVI7_9RHOB|nr:Thioesterase superfamily protein [Salipiger mucosus DSM 16094]
MVALVAWNAADRQPVVTIQMETRFLGAAKVGDFLEVRASIRQSTRSLIFLDSDVTCSTGQVASATAIMKISAKAVQTK